MAEDAVIVDGLVTNPPRTVQVHDQTTKDIENRSLLFGATFSNQHIPEATLHIFSARLDGKFTMDVKNTGKAPLLRARLENWRIDWENHRIVDTNQGLGILRRGATSTVERGWTVNGPLSVLKSLWDILWRGSTRVTQATTVRSFGYHQMYNATMVVPVGGVRIKWD